MDKDKALESVFEIKELMEKSSKFISVSGIAAILAGIYALVGAYIATQVITPGTHLIVALELMAIIASLVLVAAAVTACILSYYKSKKTGQKFFSRLTYRALAVYIASAIGPISFSVPHVFTKDIFSA